MREKGPIVEDQELHMQEKRALKKSEEKYRMLIENSDLAICYFDTEGRFVLLNRKAIKDLGEKATDIIGKSIYDVFPEEADSHMQRFIKIMNERKGAVFEDSFELPGGKRWFSSNIQPVIDENGSVRGVQIISNDIAEQKRAEEELRKSEEKYRTLFEGSLNPITIYDRNATIVMLNKIGAENLKKPLQEILGKPLGEFIPETHELTVKRIREVLKTGKPLFVEDEISLPEGKRWFLSTLHPISNPKDKPNLVQVVSYDITERKKAEEALQTSEEKFRQFFENEPEYCYMISPDGKILDINASALTALGYKKEEIVGKPLLTTIYAPSSIEKAKKLFTRWKKIGKLRNEELNIITKTGEEKTVLISADAVRSANGQIIHSISVQRDITERKHMEEALRVSEERYRLLFEQSPIGIKLSTPNGKLVSANKAMEEITGYSISELKKINLADTYKNPEDRTALLAALKREGSMVNYPVQLKRKDGTPYAALLNISSVHFDGNDLLQTTCIDITERKKVEKEILDYQARLKTLASELLLAGERERRRIAVGVHDQIGQQLALLKLELQSLGELVSDNSVCSSLDKTCGLMDQIIGDARSLPFELSNPVLYEIGVDAAVESWIGQHIPKESRLKYKVISKPSPMKPEVETSIVLFGVIRELLTNIVKHANANMLQVHIQESGQTIQVSIEDDGIGFEWPKLDSPIGETGGFGLFNARERIEYLGGSFEIKSKPGQGTCVRISVPVK
jgi:PAS domain S-box-containing protein